VVVTRDMDSGLKNITWGDNFENFCSWELQIWLSVRNLSQSFDLM